MKRLLFPLLFAASTVAFAFGDKKDDATPPTLPPVVVPPNTPAEPPPPPASTSALYLSPSGTDAGACAESAPCKTYAFAFAKGLELVLLDGTYPALQPPTGATVSARNPGGARITGGISVGTKAAKVSNVRLEGLSVAGGVRVYNGDYVTIKSTFVNGVLSIGTNDKDAAGAAITNEMNLVEDVWIRTSGVRAAAENYRANKSVWRRVTILMDGCGTSAECKKPNLAITAYDSKDVSFQNVVVTDRILSPGAYAYADFACASNGGIAGSFGNIEWLGTISVNAPDGGYYCEPQIGTTISPTMIFRHARAVNSRGSAFNLDRAGTDNVLEFITVQGTGLANGVRIANVGATIVKGIVVSGSGVNGINSRYKPENATVMGTWSKPYLNTSCTTGCSAIAGVGPDRGATIEYRYGVDGSRHGDPGYNALTAVPLWPWPNEARIQADMCVGTQRSFCGASSFSAYVRAP